MNESTNDETYTTERIREFATQEFEGGWGGIPGDEFDAWLAAHDRQVRASNREALIRELIERAESFGDRHWDQESVTAWLRACTTPDEPTADRSEQ
jgi:hypothetical protein